LIGLSVIDQFTSLSGRGAFKLGIQREVLRRGFKGRSFGEALTKILAIENNKTNNAGLIGELIHRFAKAFRAKDVNGVVSRWRLHAW